MSMSFAFITFTVFTSLKVKVTPKFLSPRASSGKNKRLFSHHCSKPIPQYVFMDADLNENSGGSTDLDQKIARIGGFPDPYYPLS